MGGLISFDQALAALAAAIEPLPVEAVELTAAHGRTLAAALLARVAAPRSATSAMDGYAVRDATTQPGTPLAVIGASFPGAPFDGEVGPGQAVRIFTGAPVPAGADRVIVQEHASRDGDEVRFSPGYGPGFHIRAVASDFAAGAMLLAAGTRLNARTLVTAAAADRAVVPVHAVPRVAIIGTGDELVQPGSAAERPHAIPESVSLGLAALVAECGGRCVARTLHRDDLAGLVATAGARLPQADVVVVTGGASVGDRDYARAMFTPHGLELVFSKVAIKPGKPVWLGRAQGRLVLGLPGNPTSAMVTAALFLQPLLAALLGRPAGSALVWRSLPLAEPLPATGDRETFVRAVWQDAGLRPLGNQDSGAQSVLAAADWLIRRPAGSAGCAAGDPVSALAL